MIRLNKRQNSRYVFISDLVSSIQKSHNSSSKYVVSSKFYIFFQILEQGKYLGHPAKLPLEEVAVQKYLPPSSIVTLTKGNVKSPMTV